MSRKSQVSFLIGFLIICLGFGVRTFLGVNLPYHTIGVWSLFGLFVGLGVFFEREIILEFLSLKTTKHGMNMGTAILLVLVLLAAVNYIAYSRNKKWDLTQERLNSLSSQTIQIAKGLDKELKLIGFFKDGQPEIQRTKEIFLDVAEKMRFENSKIKVEIYDPDKRPDLKKQYNISSLGDVVMLYDGKQKLISVLNLLQPEEAEEAIINNIFVLTANNGKALYFTTGHKEMDILSEDREGLAHLKKSLSDLNYEVKTINLLETQKIPDDAQMVIIAGPKLPIYDGEVESLIAYAKNGGRILAMADPGEKHNISKLAEVFGIDYKNNFIIDFTGLRVAGTQYLAVGLSYPSQTGITRGFKANTNFNIASEVDFKPLENVKHEVLVASSPQSIIRPELVEEIQLDSSKDKPKSRNIAVVADGKLSGSEKEFKAIFYGDASFINNNDIQVSMMNRDLILNTIAYLADQKELISIRPKKMGLSAFFITDIQTTILIIGYALVPALCIMSAGVLWYRRRHA
ncbi:MAG: GldG family protein [Bdellovibrionota bacterium]